MSRAELEALPGAERLGTSAICYLPPAAVAGQLPLELPLPKCAYYTGDAAMSSASSVMGALHAQGLAPRPYDVVPLAWGSGSLLLAPETALLENVDLARPVQRRVQELLDHGLILAGGDDWADPALFRADASGACVYVGWDRIRVPERGPLVRQVLDESARSDLHYGTELRVRGGRFLYQSIPGIDEAGRRQTERRWAVIQRLLGVAGYPVRGRVVFDVGCNAGMMLAHGLADGAVWGTGWDHPHVSAKASDLLLSLGFSRFNLVGASLDHSYDLTADVPSHLGDHSRGGVVFYLAIRHHLGFLPSLRDMPWKVMVYEGGETESLDTLHETQKALRRVADIELVEALNFRDGETVARPLAVFVRR